MEEVEHLEFHLKLLTEDHARLKADSVRQAEELIGKEQQLEEEKAEKLAVRGELDLHSQRVLTMLRNAKGDHLGMSQCFLLMYMDLINRISLCNNPENYNQIITKIS